MGREEISDEEISKIKEHAEGTTCPYATLKPEKLAALCRRALEAGALDEDKRNLARIGTEACHEGMRLSRELEVAKAESDRLAEENARLREQLAAALLDAPECTEGCRL